MITKRSLSVVLTCLGLILLSGVASAQSGTPSSKASADITTLTVCTVQASSNGSPTTPNTIPIACTNGQVTPDNFVQIMGATVKVSNSESLFVSPSLVTGLYTQTQVKGNNGSSSSATAMGGVYMRAILTNASTGQQVIGAPVSFCGDSVLGCGNVAGVYGVTLDTRIQTLTATLGTALNCLTVTTCTTVQESIDLALSTTSTHTFNYIFPNVGAGTWYLSIQAAVNASAMSSANASALAEAAFGLGSVTIDTVRLIHDFSFQF